MTDENEAIRSWRAALSAAGAQALPGASCPAPQRVWAAAGGELSRPETVEVLDHASGCPSCSLAWRLATQLCAQVDELQEGGGAVAAPAPRARRWLWGIAAAATLAAALVGLRMWPPSQPETPTRYRQPGDTTILSLIGEEQILSRDACVLRWSPGPAGTTFSIEVATQNLQIVAQARGLEEPEFQVSPAALAALPPDTRLLWRVEAFLADGRRLSSPTFLSRLE